MDTVDSQVLDAARAWGRAGQHFALLTVVRTWGSAPRPVGAWMALKADGEVHGSVSGGCIEDDLIRRMRAGEFAGGPPRLLRYGVSADEAQRFGLPCGGSLELVLEAAPDLAALDELAARLAEGQLARRQLALASGRVSIAAAHRSEPFQWDGQTLVTLHGPAWRLLLIGAGQISRFVAPMAQALGYQVLVCDPRVEYSQGWDVPGATWLPGMPDDVVQELGLDPHSAVVALTHDPKLDDLALLEALKSPAFYVGALGSRANNDKRRQRLREYFDLSADEIARLHGPVGLSIGSRTPPEIAVAIVAEMTALKNGATLGPQSGCKPSREPFSTAGCTLE
jgi:xanthine dehydrogenase accessory factor